MTVITTGSSFSSCAPRFGLAAIFDFATTLNAVLDLEGVLDLEVVLDFDTGLAFAADFAGDFALDAGFTFCFCLAIGLLA
jgi:hypothetical protein